MSGIDSVLRKAVLSLITNDCGERERDNPVLPPYSTLWGSHLNLIACSLTKTSRESLHLRTGGYGHFAFKQVDISRKVHVHRRIGMHLIAPVLSPRVGTDRQVLLAQTLQPIGPLFKCISSCSKPHMRLHLHRVCGVDLVPLACLRGRSRYILTRKLRAFLGRPVDFHVTIESSYNSF